MLRRLTLGAGILGAVLAVAGLITYAVSPQRTWMVAGAEAVAVICLIFFLVMHFELFREFSTRRSVRLGLNSVLMVVLLAVILGILSFLATRHSVRWDFSETKRFTLAPQSARLMRELPREVKVTVFTNDQSPARSAYRDLLESYKAHAAKLSVEFVDPEKKPGLARRYGITRLDTAVLESGKQETRITSPTEQELTNALSRVTKDDKKVVYFLTGHGEHGLDDTTEGGYSFLKKALEQQGYTIHPLSLYESKSVPAEATVLVMGGPQRPVPQEEQALIAEYIKKGGRLLVMLDPGSRAQLQAVLGESGLQADDRTVLDEQKILGGDLTMPVVSNYGVHEIPQDLTHILTVFPHVRPISFQESKGSDWEYHPLAKSSPRSWASPEERGEIRFDPTKDAPGPFVLAAVATARKEAEHGRQAAVLAIGDSDIATNAFLNLTPGNNDFMLHAVAWLAEEKDLITIAPKDTAFATFLLTAAQANALFTLQVLVIPVLLLSSGFAVWRYRRRL